MTISSNQMERSLEQLTQGLAGLDISQPPPSVLMPVGGARPKVAPLSKRAEGEVEAESGHGQSEETTLPQVSQRETWLPHFTALLTDGVCCLQAVAAATPEPTVVGAGEEPDLEGERDWPETAEPPEVVGGAEMGRVRTLFLY